jgi:hypothetical protein
MAGLMLNCNATLEIGEGHINNSRAKVWNGARHLIERNRSSDDFRSSCPNQNVALDERPLVRASNPHSTISSMRTTVGKLMNGIVG